MSRYDTGKERGARVDTRKAVVHNFDPRFQHDTNIATDGLEELFDWATEMVNVEANDPRSRRTREQKVRRDVLGMIQHAKEVEASEKFGDELFYLQRRVIALLQLLAEKTDELSALKQIVLTQYIALSRLADLESELKQLQAMTWYREEAEAERKHLMDALAKLKKERDFLDELLCATERENIRVAQLYKNLKDEHEVLKNRRWWHVFKPLVARVSQSAFVAQP
jgi:hypothetical protein